MRGLRKVALAALIAAGGALTSGCVEDGYGYGGASIGYGAPAYYDDGYGYAGDPYGYGAYGGGIGYGWYNDFYYPGSGYYVFDRGGRRHRWDGDQQRHWQSARGAGRGEGGPRGFGQGRPGWSSDRDVRRGYRGTAQRGAATAGQPGVAGPGTRPGEGRTFQPGSGITRGDYRTQRGVAVRGQARGPVGGGAVQGGRGDGGGHGGHGRH